MFNEVKNITTRQAFISILVFTGGIAPGVLSIFYFDPELFKSLDVLKLVILSMGISLPIVWLNLFVASIHVRSVNLKDRLNGEPSKTYSSTEEKNKDELLFEFIVALWSSSVVFYTTFVFIFFKELSIEYALFYAAGFQVFVYVLAALTHLSNKKLQKELDGKGEGDHLASFELAPLDFQVVPSEPKEIKGL
ncbi:hypothetical protein [Neptuniibacter sp. QD37_11]|uniref:hypothetical protein n=1 Tax=Neptuniibacter sp. QD37_11 TaxID=3398209 RepID=UPI0039F4CD7B